MWAEEQQAAFNDIKEARTSPPLLALPDVRADAPMFVLATGAPDFAAGAVLSQEQPDGTLRVVVYYSSTFKDAELRWASVEKELNADVHATRRFQQLVLLGWQFCVITDCSTLVWLLKKQNPPMKLVRWLQNL